MWSCSTKFVRVGPVVRDVARRVVAHHVDPAPVAHDGVVVARRSRSAPARRPATKPSILPPSMSCAGAAAAVRAAGVDVGVVERTARAARRRVGIGDADRRDAVRHRDPVGARERPEVAVERAVLLHDHDDVLDLVDPLSAAPDDRAWNGGQAPIVAAVANAPATATTARVPHARRNPPPRPCRTRDGLRRTSTAIYLGGLSHEPASVRR